MTPQNLDTFEDLFTTDENLSVNGVWMPMGQNSKGEEFSCLIAEAGNPKHEAAQRRYAKQLENTRRSPERHRNVLCRIVAETILLDWKGRIDAEGNEVKADLKARTKALIKYKKFFYAVMEISADESHYKPEGSEGKSEVEQDTKGN